MCEGKPVASPVLSVVIQLQFCGAETRDKGPRKFIVLRIYNVVVNLCHVVVDGKPVASPV